MNATTTNTSGPDFVSFQVRDLAASASLYEDLVGLERLPATNPASVVFSAGGTAFAVRTPFPGVDLEAQPLGAGIGVWFHNEDTAAVHQRLLDAKVQIVQEPTEGPFGLQFSFRDLDGYVVTLHSKA